LYYPTLDEVLNVRAADLAEDLERWLEGRSIIARRVSASLQMWRWSRRTRYSLAHWQQLLVLLWWMWWAAFAISHLLSIIGQTRLADHTIASVRFENLRELTPALNSIAEAKNLVPAASGNQTPISVSLKNQKLTRYVAAQQEINDSGKALSVRTSVGSVLEQRFIRVSARAARNGQNSVIGFIATRFQK
jgi:hypothetical protein